MNHCTVEGCNNKYNCMGYCQKHYFRIRNNNTLDTKHEMHGLRNTPEYNVWNNMVRRCKNVSHPDYINYGGRGITVCDRWKNSFTNFYSDMGDRPTDKHSLDRKDNDGNYEPTNCRWATLSQQRVNQRLSHHNKSGVRGVCWDRQSSKWRAYYNKKTLGNFISFDDAVSARITAESI